MQQLFTDHAPFTAILSAMVLLGTFVNYNQTDTTIVPKDMWCKNQSSEITMPNGLNAATLAMSLIFPVAPHTIKSLEQI